MKTSRRNFLITSILSTLSLSNEIKAFSTPVKQMILSHNISERKKKFPISVFSKHLQWLGYLEMASTASELGFDGIDLTVRPGGHVLPERVKIDLPRAAEAIRNAGLDVYMITTSITDPEDKYTEDILKTAGGLNIPYYRMGWIPFLEGVSIEKNMEYFRNNFSRLAELNKKYNIRGDYQNHSGTMLGGSIWDLWLAIKDVDNEWVGCQYDIRHAVVEGAFSWPVGFELIHPFIHTLDFKDFLWARKDGKWDLENVTLGHGKVDFLKYLKLLKKYNIKGPISLHYEYDLGGAEHGHKAINISKEKLMAAMKRDLETLKRWLEDSQLY